MPWQKFEPIAVRLKRDCWAEFTLRFSRCSRLPRLEFTLRFPRLPRFARFALARGLSRCSREVTLRFARLTPVKWPIRFFTEYRHSSMQWNDLSAKRGIGRYLGLRNLMYTASK